jgi:hypothetical protein
MEQSLRSRVRSAAWGLLKAARLMPQGQVDALLELATRDDVFAGAEAAAADAASAVATAGGSDQLGAEEGAGAAVAKEEEGEAEGGKEEDEVKEEE